jgi:hypothetical protein
VRPSWRRSRAVGLLSSVAGTSAIASWAVAQSTAPLAPIVALAGIAGTVTLASAFVGRRVRTISTSLVLVGIAVVVGSLHEAAGTRAGVLSVSGAVLFCIAEVADRSLDQPRGVDRRRGVRHWNPAWVLGVAAASAAAGYGAASIRGAVAGGGPAALAAGTIAATLVGFLARGALRTRVRS